MSEAIQISETKPAALMRTATDIAGLCREIVMRRAISIKGKKYVKVEEWCTIASLWGAIPSIQSVTVEDTGIKAVCELKTHTGQVLATAEGYVGNDEEMWQKRPLFARRAMAQTRAISRVCRTAYAFVIPMIDAGLSTTPAEEMGFDEIATEPKVVSISPPPSHAPVATPEEAHFGLTSQEPKPVLAPFGKQKDKPLTAHSQPNLDWLERAISDSVNDPTKSKWKKNNAELLAAIQAEQQRRQGKSQTFQADPLESDIPF